MCSSPRQVLLDPLELRRRHHVGEVELAGAVLAQLGAGVRDVHEMHALEPGRAVVPVAWIALHHHVRADDPVVEHERPVRDQLAGTRVLGAVRRQRRAMHGEGAGLRQQAEQVRRRRGEADQHRAVVGRADAQRLRRHLAAGDGAGVQHRVDELRIRRRRAWIDQASHAGDVIRRPQRVAVRPAQARAAARSGTRGRRPRPSMIPRRRARRSRPGRRRSAPRTRRAGC